MLPLLSNVRTMETGSSASCGREALDVQLRIVDEDGRLIARVDLAWPELGVHAVLIERAGKLIYEAYFDGFDERWGLPIGRVATPDDMADVIAFLKHFVPANKSPMCGNSVHQDRRFLARYMPRLEAYFHYRNLDVSTLKELAKRWKPGIMGGLVKHGKHEALADIYESIEELRYYREHLLKL